MVLAPKSAAAMIRLENSLANAQASYEVQPRVFYEDFKDYVLYVQDVRASAGAANWRGIFLADVTNPGAPKITTADRATVVNGPNQTMTMRLRDGTVSQTVPGQPDQYTISTFGQTDLPLQTGAQEDVRLGRSDTPILAMNNHQLLARARGRNGQVYEIEFEKRLAYPAACLVLMLVGVPLGISSRRGGKGAGFVLTIALVFVYYFLSSTGTALARQNKIPAFLGVWQANLIFAFCGIVLLRQMATGGAALSALSSLGNWFRLRAEGSAATIRPCERLLPAGAPPAADSLSSSTSMSCANFFLTFVMVLVTFVMLMLIFTFFELLSDIIKNKTPLVTVGEYLINLTPSMIYLITPLSVLIGVLVVFGIMNRNSELTAMKATGISLYRITVPVIAIAAVLSVSLFMFDELYLPQANRRQEALRNVIKGKPAETFEHPGRKWIFGQQHPGRPNRIFYYEYFDSDIDTFGNISVFEFNPGSFTIARRIFASTAHWEPNLNTWVFEDGWERTFNGSTDHPMRLSPSKHFAKSPSSPLTSRKKCANPQR